MEHRFYLQKNMILVLANQFLVHFILTSSSRLFDHSGRPASENGNDAEDDAPRKRQIWRKMSGSPMVLEVVSMYLISLKCTVAQKLELDGIIVQCGRFKRVWSLCGTTPPWKVYQHHPIHSVSQANSGPIQLANTRTGTRAQCGLSEDAGHQDRCEKNIGEEPQLPVIWGR